MKPAIRFFLAQLFQNLCDFFPGAVDTFDFIGEHNFINEALHCKLPDRHRRKFCAQCTNVFIRLVNADDHVQHLRALADKGRMLPDHEVQMNGVLLRKALLID